MADKRHLLTALSTVAAASFSLSAMAAGENTIDPFQAEELPAGFMVASADISEGSCGEDKERDKDEEGNCGEGNCGEDEEKHKDKHKEKHKEKHKDKDKEKDKDKDEEGNCGEGTCGS